MELLALVAILFIVYGVGWVWRTLHDIARDVRRSDWDSRVYGQVASPRAVRRSLGNRDLGRLRRNFRRFAELRDGELHERALFESPKVSFCYHGSRVLLSLYESNDPAPQFYTQLTFTIPPGWPGRIEIFPQRFRDDDVRYLNVDDIRVGDPTFDPRYVVKSNDPAFAREFLDPATRKDVEDLRNLKGNDRILISANSSRLMVRKPSLLGDLGDLEVFTELSCRLYDRLLLFIQKASGIEILEGPAPGASGDPVCQVCGAAITAEARIFCRRCRTPHHKDCWEFNGQCSTYACGEKRYVAKY